MALDPQLAARLCDRVRAATVVLPADVSLKPARFALVVPADRDPLVVAAEVAAVFLPLGAVVGPLSALDRRVLLLTFPGRAFVADPAAAFQAAYDIGDAFELEAAEPDLATDVFPEPDSRRRGPASENVDDFPPGCWAAEEPALTDSRWALTNMAVQDAWAFSEARGRPSRGEGVVIAQPDTGVVWRHPEMLGVTRAAGYDFVAGDSDPADPLNYIGNPGHGTGTGSVVVSPAAGTVTGSAPTATHMSIRAIESVVRLSQVTVAQAIDFAVANGAHVITMSLGGIPSFSLHRALQRAVAADVIVLAAAGNCVGTVVWPARYDDCLAVAGVDSKGQAWCGTCRGPDVDISAPAQNVYRAHVERTFGADGTVVATSVGQGQGTSFAVALTAGVAACWLAHHGRANLIGEARRRGESLQVMFRRLLRASAKPSVPWDVLSLGAGIVDARALLAADFDLGREREDAGLVAPPDAAALSVRRFVAEAVNGEAALGDVDWQRYGPEIALALLRQKRGAIPVARGATVAAEAAASITKPSLSPALEIALAHGAIAQKLGRSAVPEPAP